MPAVSIGVPVYNGEDFLDECLACLAGQTFRDIEVLVWDNASTDRTGDIARAWEKRDPRFRYFRQETNRGVWRNFSDVLTAGKSEYFMWRAHDDLSAPDFIEVLHRLLVEAPNANLAVASLRKTGFDGSPAGKRRVRSLERGPKLARIHRLVSHYHPSWFYGLWRRQALADTFNALWSAYPHTLGFDHLTLFGLALDEAIVGSNVTYFVQRKSRNQYIPSPAKTAQIRGEFARQVHSMIDRRSMPRCERLVLHWMALAYVRRFFKRRKLERTPRSA